MTRVAQLLTSLLVALALQPAAASARAAAGPIDPAICDETSQSFALNDLLVEGLPVTVVLAGDDPPPAWCLTPDDPRCSPRDASAPLHNHLLLVPLCDYEQVKLPQLRGLEPDSVPAAVQLGAALPGIAGRVERPPRG